MHNSTLILKYAIFLDILGHVSDVSDSTITKNNNIFHFTQELNQIGLLVFPSIIDLPQFSFLQCERTPGNVSFLMIVSSLFKWVLFGMFQHFCRWKNYFSLFSEVDASHVSSTHFTFTFSHLADTFIQSNLQMRKFEAIKANKRATTCKCYDQSCLA